VAVLASSVRSIHVLGMESTRAFIGEDKGSLLGAADGALEGVDEIALVGKDEGSSLLGAAEEAPEDEG
jgi:sigma54-dependent transcription regulator